MDSLEQKLKQVEAVAKAKDAETCMHTRTIFGLILVLTQVLLGMMKNRKL